MQQVKLALRFFGVRRSFAASGSRQAEIRRRQARRAAAWRGSCIAASADWSGPTLDAVLALRADQLVGGRGAVVRGAAVDQAIEDTRAFLQTTLRGTREVMQRGGTLKEAFELVHGQLAPRYAGYPIFDHTMPFNVQRAWDELEGIDHPRIWTTERDREVWDALQG